MVEVVLHGFLEGPLLVRQGVLSFFPKDGVESAYVSVLECKTRALQRPAHSVDGTQEEDPDEEGFEALASFFAFQSPFELDHDVPTYC